jgi:hypothetical protein
MRIIAYTYEADVHCIDCTRGRFADSPNARIKWTQEVDEHGVWNDSQFPTLDAEGNLVHPLFSIDEWQELDTSFLAENPTQYLACGDCHEIIDEYTVCQECGEQIPNGDNVWHSHAGYTVISL